MLALSFVFPDKVPIKATEGALWHNKRSQYLLIYFIKITRWNTWQMLIFPGHDKQTKNVGKKQTIFVILEDEAEASISALDDALSSMSTTTKRLNPTTLEVVVPQCVVGHSLSKRCKVSWRVYWKLFNAWLNFCLDII